MSLKRHFPFLLCLLLAGTGSFAAVPSPSMNLSFIVFGDNRPADATRDISDTFLRVVKKMSTYAGKAEFAVALGDMVTGSTDPVVIGRQIDIYLNALKGFKLQIYHVPGNHEICGNKTNEEIYEDRFGPAYFSVERNGCLLIFLNSEDLKNAGEISGEQLEWLKAELKKQSPVKIVFIHRPFFPAYHRNPQNTANRDMVWSLFREHGVTAVFAGHEHFFDRSEHDGIPQIITGGAGAPLYPSPKPGGSYHHFCMVTVKDGQIDVKLVPVK